MISDRVVVRSNTDNHVLFKVFKACYDEKTTGSYPTYDHHHAELELSYFISGSGVYSCSGTDYRFKTGDVFIHCGNDVHNFKTIDEPPTLIVIRFEPRLIWNTGGDWQSLRYLHFFMNGSTVPRCIDSRSETAAQLRELISECFDECSEKRPAYELVVRAKLYTMLAVLARHYSAENGMPQKLSLRNAESMEHAMNYILSHLDKPLTLSELAQQACMSRSAFSSTFKALNGVSAWDYITLQRIDRAQHLLETSAMTVIEISESCGYNNIANFNRTFKRMTGKTPREYRRSMDSPDT